MTKLLLDIGYFDGAAGESLSRPVDAGAVEDAIIRAGGRLLADGHPTNPHKTRMAASAVRHGIRVLGFLGIENVILHPTGYVRLSFDHRSVAPIARFLRLLHIEQACGAYMWDDEEVDIEKILERLGEIGDATKD